MMAPDSEPQEFREGTNHRARVDSIVFKEKVALGLVGYVGVRVVKRRGPFCCLGLKGLLSGCCGRSALSGP